MGDGAFGSNGSVHWQVRYKDNPAVKPAHRDEDVSKRHPGDRRLGLPTDRRARPMIGHRKPGGSPEERQFRVIARYPDKHSAKKALERAMKRLNGGRVVFLDVDLRPFRQHCGNPDHWEVKVRW